MQVTRSSCRSPQTGPGSSPRAAYGTSLGASDSVARLTIAMVRRPVVRARAKALEIVVIYIVASAVVIRAVATRAASDLGRKGALP